MAFDYPEGQRLLELKEKVEALYTVYDTQFKERPHPPLELKGQGSFRCYCDTCADWEIRLSDYSKILREAKDAFHKAYMKNMDVLDRKFRERQ